MTNLIFNYTTVTGTQAVAMCKADFENRTLAMLESNFENITNCTYGEPDIRIAEWYNDEFKAEFQGFESEVLDIIWATLESYMEMKSSEYYAKLSPSCEVTQHSDAVVFARIVESRDYIVENSPHEYELQEVLNNVRDL